MTWAVILNAILGFIMVLTLCFTMGDATSILETDTLFPFIQIFYNTTQSYAATNVMVTILIVTLTSSAISEVATASRQLWSFARDGGVPFAAFLQRVSRMTHIYLSHVMKANRSCKGYTRLEHPPQRRPRLPRRHNPPLPHQHRLHSRPKRHHLPHHRLPCLLLHDHHLLHTNEAYPQRTTPSSPLDIRPLRLRCQCLRSAVLTSHLRFLLLPASDARHTKYDELGHRAIQ